MNWVPGSHGASDHDGDGMCVELDGRRLDRDFMSSNCA